MSVDETKKEEWKQVKNKVSQRMKEIAEEVRGMTNFLENYVEIDMEKLNPKCDSWNAYKLTSKDNKETVYGPFRSIEDAFRFILWRDLKEVQQESKNNHKG